MSNFEELIDSYGDHNSEYNALKKICDTEKSQIKTEMEQRNIKGSVATDKYKVTYSVAERETLNEDKMLEILQADWNNRYPNMPCPYIKSKPYIDMDVLETVLYAGEIPDDVVLLLDTCRDVKEVVTLRCSKVKKNKTDTEE